MPIMNLKYKEVAEKTRDLSRKLKNQASLREINKIKNIGKRIQMCVSATLILDILEAFEELCSLFDKDLKKTKVSKSLLIRYIFESYITFLYIFNVPKGQTQIRTKAFYYYGDYKRTKIQEKKEEKYEKEWNKYLPKKEGGTQWHGKSFQKIAKEVKYSPVVYQVLSQFTHPGIFTLERIEDTEMFRGIFEDTMILTSASVCDVIDIAKRRRLYGLKLNSKKDEEIDSLVNFHKKIIDGLKK